MANPFGAAPGIMVGVGVGEAAAAALEPIVEPARQSAWEKNRNAILDAGLIAQLAARGGITLPAAKTTNHLHGLTDDKTEALVWLAQTMPDLGELDELSNRKLIGPDDVEEALTRHGIPEKWHQAIRGLFVELLGPADLARAIHRGLVKDPGLLQGVQPTAEGKVPAYPVYPIDALIEAAGAGIDRDRLGVLVGLQGLPMGPHEAAQALFRGVIDGNDYLRAIAEGNTRNEWAEAIREQTRQIPTARDFLENALRGYRSLASAIAGAELHGMTAEYATMIYQNQGRPMNVRAITTALARGGVFKPEPGELTDPYEAAIVEGNLKPAYYDLAKANRYTLPSPFVMRQLTTSGVWSEAKTAERLKWAGWFPQDADEAAKAWAGSGAAATGGSARVKLAATQAVAALKKRFLVDGIDGAGVIAGLELVGETAADAGSILELWTLEKGWTDRPLTPAQIKAAFAAGELTEDEAVAALVELHMADGDARLYLRS